MTAYVTAASGNWSTSTNWTPNGIPGNGDNITAVNHAMTVDVNTIIGVSPATAGTAAIVMNANVAITIAAGVTLTCRGDFTGKMTGTTVIDQLILGAGSVFEFDTSQAASPTSQLYAFRQTGNNQWWRVVCNGTGTGAAQKCEIRSNAGGGVGFVDNSFVGGPYFHCTYTRFLRMGSAAKQMMEIYLNGGSLPELYFSQCIFDTCGRLFQRDSSTAGATVTYSKCAWINSANADDNVRLATLSGAGATGTMSDCYLDCSFAPFVGMQNWTLTNNTYRRGNIAGSVSTSKATLSQNNVVGFISNNAANAFADYTNEYWINESTSDNNVHGTNLNPNFGLNMTGLVFEGSYTGAGQTEADLLFPPAAAPSGVVTYNVKNCLVLPQPDGVRALGVLVSIVSTSNTNWKFNVEHNTVWDVRNTGSGNYGVINVGESGGGAVGMFTSVKSNLAYSTTATSVAFIARLAASVLQDAVSSANVTNNALNNAFTGTGGFAGFDDGTGGGSMFSSGTPNASGVTLTGNPFVDTTRRMSSWSASLGGAASNAGAFDLLRRRIDWTDGAYNASSSATPSALLSWVKAGWNVTGTAGQQLLNVGHDGVTIGALPYVSGSITAAGGGEGGTMYWYKNGQTSVVLRTTLTNSSTGGAFTGLTNSSTGLIISTIADNEAAATVYTSAGSLIDTIATIGTYAAPTATHCRFREIDSNNHPGLYEIQISDARFAVANAKSLDLSISGVTNLVAGEIRIVLTKIDPYDVQSLYTSAMAESYAANGAPMTVANALYQITQMMAEPNWVGTTLTVKKLDHATTAMTLTADSAANPTKLSRTT